VCEISDAMLPYIGEGGIGTACTAGNQCRSGMCANDTSGGGAYCIEPCTARGGCPHGFGCLPLRPGGSDYYLYCVRAGARGFGETCAVPADCRTGYCETGRCTRICNDGYCPRGTACQTTGIVAGGEAIRICR
jgi:hypothetical protein